ncbi:MAG: hypothetical protein ACI382_09230 [Alloprevotella sp.]
MLLQQHFIVLNIGKKMNSSKLTFSVPGALFRLFLLLLAIMPAVEGSEAGCKTLWILMGLCIVLGVSTSVHLTVNKGKGFLLVLMRGRSPWTALADLAICIVGIVLCYQYDHQLLRFWEFMACLSVLELAFVRGKSGKVSEKA